MSNCSACGAPLETPVACGACGAVHAVALSATPFEILGLPQSFRLDERELRRRSTRYSRWTHPDFFAAAVPRVRELAEENSARLNSAFETLAQPTQRGDWLVVHLGGPSEDAERAMPQSFLLEVLEWNEVLEEARSSAVLDSRVEPLFTELMARRAANLAQLDELLEPLPQRNSGSLVLARRELNALRYLDRALREIESLRLARAERR